MWGSYGEQDDAGRLHGVLRGQHDAAMVHTPVKVRVRRPSHRKVPLKQVILWAEASAHQSTCRVI